MLAIAVCLCELNGSIRRTSELALDDSLINHCTIFLVPALYCSLKSDVALQRSLRIICLYHNDDVVNQLAFSFPPKAKEKC